MKVKQIANNMIEVVTMCENVTGSHFKYYVMVSYETPVVVIAYINGKQSVYINKKWYSKTTTSHINKYLTGIWKFRQSQVDKMPRVNKFSILDDTGKPMTLMSD